jgi:cell division protein FtsB/cell division protein DivIC
MATSNPPSAEKGPGRRIPWVPVIIILFILGAGLFGEKGALRMLKARRQKADLERQVAEKQEINRDLKKEINRLKTDRIYIEALARKELGMVGDGEVVYQFPGEEADGKDKGTSSSMTP